MRVSVTDQFTCRLGCRVRRDRLVNAVVLGKRTMEKLGTTSCALREQAYALLGACKTAPPPAQDTSAPSEAKTQPLPKTKTYRLDPTKKFTVELRACGPAAQQSLV